jgi:RNA polymerase sigma-70 factor (ECF subfamily)
MADLVTRAAGGDTSAFEQLYRDNVGRIHALCMRMTGNPAEAEELTQEAFIRAWEKLDTFRGDANFSTWMHRVAANVVLSYRRSAARRRERIHAEEDLSYHEEPDDRTDRGPGVDLEEAIAKLPDGAREIFVLFDIEGYRHDEIAEMTGLATGTTKAQLHRARKLLREALNR